MKKPLIIFFFFTCCFAALGQRNVISINSDWQFAKVGDEWTKVNLPHTYNAVDAFDDDPGYYRGKASYQRVLNTSYFDKDKKYFIRFAAVNQVAEVLLNGRSIGNHEGGYTSFTLDLTDHLTFGLDTIVVRVDNSHNVNIPPLKGDFTFYGGIYRNVELISVAKAHFSLDHYGSDGVYIDPIKVEDKSARIGVRGYVDNFAQSPQEVVVSIYGEDGLFVSKKTFPTYSKSAGEWNLVFDLKNVELWTIENPYLYTFHIQLIDKESNDVLDEIRIPYGFRSYSFDPDKGFFLNGQHVKLIGVNRHQDRPLIGNALNRDHHMEDMDLIKDMGANFLRTAHYPQDQSITDYCDRNGILVSMEIPLDHEITDSEEFAQICRLMTQEMIHQYYNHPSVIIWAYMNEMGLGKNIEKDREEMTRVADLAQDLEDVIRESDPYRYTMIPNHGDFDVYHHFGLTEIPMLVGWNLYYGWYEPGFEGFGRFVDHAHKMVPSKPMLITEYGAGADPRISSTAPERFDFSLDWAYEFHKSHLTQILERDFIAGSAVWNMFDFGSESRQDAVPHINNKGLCAYDRTPKPVFYLYQSHLRDDVEVARSKGVRLSDEDMNSYWTKEDHLSINMGTSFTFTPSDVETAWLPSEHLTNSLIDIENGRRYTVRDRGIGSDRSINLTHLDPVYQTQVEGLTKMSLPLPNGSYHIILHYCNLSSKTKQAQYIKINESSPIYLSPDQPFQAYTQASDIAVEDGIIKLEFISDIGNTFINGIQIFKQ